MLRKSCDLFGSVLKLLRNRANAACMQAAAPAAIIAGQSAPPAKTEAHTEAPAAAAPAAEEKVHAQTGGCHP
jgi:hypothetical protein